MRNQRLLVLFASLIIAGCECQRPNTFGISGEVLWEWETAAGTQGDTKAFVDFPGTTMGARRDETLFVRNVGRAAFTMTDFAKLMGAATTLNLTVEPSAAFEVHWDPTVTLSPTERTQVVVSFTPPLTEGMGSVDYESDLELRPQGAAAAPLTLRGKAIAGQCDVPAVIDFGSVPLRSTLSSDVDVRNDSAAAVRVTASGVTGAPVGIFTVSGLQMGNALTVAANSEAKLTITFQPSESGDFNGQMNVKRGESCPERVVQLKGRGVNSCLTWKAEPPDDAMGLGLHFGSVAPSAVGTGRVVFSNSCSIAAELSGLRTSDPVFVITAAQPGDLTTLVVPAATRDPAGTWTNGTATTELEFRPVVLGPRLGQLQASTSLSSQPGVAVSLKGFGGGPRIEVRPSPVFAIGRIGFSPGSMPGTSAQRNLRVANVGNRPATPDPRTNLKLGALGTGTTYYEVRAINGTDDELCVGDWDAATASCPHTLSPTLYNPAIGIEASVTAALQLPVRVIPATAGLKEWEITIFSNDIVTPEVKVRITAEAIVAPPCNYTVSPTNLPFGLMTVPEVKDLSFTLTNLGTQPSELCYFNGIDLAPGSDAIFSIVSNPIDLTLAAGQSTTITVRAQPTTQPSGGAPTVSGAVTFNVSTPGAPQAQVQLTATLVPACVTITPQPMVFNDTQLECGSPERPLVITNTCSTSVTLNSTVLTDAAVAPTGSGSCTTAAGCPQFALTSAPPGGAILPGASRTVLVRFRPYVSGAASGVLTITMQQGTQTVPYNIPLNANGIPRTMATCGVTAVCPPPMTVNANSTVTLAPTIMAPGAVTCAWSASMRPTTSNGTFSAPTSCTSTNYFADVVGTHVVSFNVSDGLGGTSQCTTPITVTANGDLWIELTWNRPNDMDLHLLHPNAGPASSSTSWFNTTWDCDYVNTNPNWTAGLQSDPSLDRDDITGQGPENTRINTPVQNLNYTIGVHVYSYAAAAPVTSTLKLYCGGQLVTTQTRTMSVVKDMWVVGTVRFQTGVPCVFTANNTVVNVP